MRSIRLLCRRFRGREIKRILVSGLLWKFSAASAIKAYVNSTPAPASPSSGIRHFLPIDAISMEFFARNFPVRHTWMCRLLGIIMARLGLPAKHLGLVKGGRANPKCIGSRESAFGRNSRVIPIHRRRRRDASTPHSK
jgi:hypothetical protein